MRVAFAIIIGLCLLPSKFLAQEEMPEYPGGMKAMMNFIHENLSYPDSAKQKGIEGKVYLKFVVDSLGKIGNIKVVKSVNPLLDKAAIEVMKKMPRWKPVKRDGKLVNIPINIPITFSLKEDDLKK